jgi:2,3-bisphosphoglycerate-dependent phosphoglycerate mutase
VTRLLIARHGNTFEAHEAPRRVGSRTDIPLTEEGRAQARAIGQYLKKKNMLPQAVFSGHLRRTKETARVALIESGVNLFIQEESIFDEIDYGPDENKTEDDVIARIGKKALEAWDSETIVPSGWKADPDEIVENWRTFAARIAKDYAGCTIMAVTSNGIARFAPHLTGDFKDFAKNNKLKISTGGLCLLEYQDGRWSIREWNLRP